MVLRSKFIIFSVSAFAAAAASYFLIQFDTLSFTLTAGIACIILMLMAVFSGASTGSKKSAILPLKNSNDVLYKGTAYRYIDEETEKGMLYLLEDKLVFQSARFRAKQETIIALEEVKDVSFSKTYNSIDRRIVITTESGKQSFLVKGNQLWVDVIENALKIN